MIRTSFVNRLAALNYARDTGLYAPPAPRDEHVCFAVENQSPSGRVVSRSQLVTLPSVQVAQTAKATGSFSFPGAEVGGIVAISPSADLGTGAILSDARVSAANVITFTLASVGAAVTVASQQASCFVALL